MERYGAVERRIVTSYREHAPHRSVMLLAESVGKRSQRRQRKSRIETIQRGSFCMRPTDVQPDVNVSRRRMG